MAYIQTRPQVGPADIDDLIARLESVKTEVIDEVVLSNLVRVCYECALKKSGLIDLSIEDVAKGGIVRDILRIGDSELKLSGQARKMLQSHIDYLKLSGYRLYPSKPLFPTRKKTRYTEKTLGNHLKKAQNSNI